MSSFKQALAGERPLLGLWQALANNYTADICARAGYDWLLFDGEHSPNTAQALLGQLQAVTPYPLEPVARVPSGDARRRIEEGFRSSQSAPISASSSRARRR